MTIDLHQLVGAVFICLLIGLACPGDAMAEDPVNIDDNSGPRADVDESHDDPVHRAEQALAKADFERLTPLLEDVVQSGDTEYPARAHLLYGLGLFFEARTGDDPELEQRATEHIEKALELSPDLSIDPQLYPPRFVAQFADIREHDTPNATTDHGSEDAPIFYFERRIETRSRLPLFLPGGGGQFYRGAVFRGLTFLGIQLVGLGANAMAYWKVEGLRNPSGRIDPSELNRAQTWRQVQVAGIATFVGGWLLGIADAHRGFERQSVRIRTLDEPPPELRSGSGVSGTADGLPTATVLEWTLNF